MSQAGLLSEEELRSYINENFNLKLDRDTFLKPTREVIFDIYARFLDHLHRPWKEASQSFNLDESGILLKVRMVSSMQELLSVYNTPYEFNMSDIIMPTRKRTTNFMNVLIFIKAQCDDQLAEWQADKEELLERQENATEMKRANNQLNLEIEEMAIAKANSKPIEEFQRDVIDKRRYFEEIRVANEEFSNTAKQVKESVKHKEKLLGRQDEELEPLHKCLGELENTITLLDGGRMVRKTIQESRATIGRDSEQLEALRSEYQKAKEKSADSEKHFYQLELTKDDMPKLIASSNKLSTKGEDKRKIAKSCTVQLRDRLDHLTKESDMMKEQIAASEHYKNKMAAQRRIKFEQKKQDCLKTVGASDETKRHHEVIFTSRSEDIKHLKSERAKIAAEVAEVSERNRASIDRSDKELELLKRKILESRVAAKQYIPNINKTQRQIEALMGQPKETGLQPPADRTYIKEPDRTYIKEKATHPSEESGHPSKQNDQAILYAK